MADNGEHGLKQGQRIREVEYDMKQHYCLRKFKLENAIFFRVLLQT